MEGQREESDKGVGVGQVRIHGEIRDRNSESRVTATSKSWTRITESTKSWAEDVEGT